MSQVIKSGKEDKTNMILKNNNQLDGLEIKFCIEMRFCFVFLIDDNANQNR